MRQDEHEPSEADPYCLSKSPEQAEGQPGLRPEPERRERGGVGTFERAQAAGHEEGGEANGRAQRLDHERRGERRANLKHPQEQPRLHHAHEPPEQVESD